MKTKVALARCREYGSEEVDRAVEKVLDLLGGIQSIIKPNSRVLIKPNLLTDSLPEECITTHPRVIEAIIRAVKKVTPNIYVGDSPGYIGQRIEADKVYEATGIKEVCRRQGVKLVYFDKAVLKKNIPLTDWLESCDCIINVPKFKTHGLTTLTGAIKNLFGLVLGAHKVKLHKEHLYRDDFSKQLVDIFGLVKPALTIVDAVIAIEGDGPGSSGTRIDTELILASQDAVAVDSILATVMGLFPLDIPTTKEAFSRKLGEANIENMEILGENLGEFIHSDFKLPKMSLVYCMPKPLFKLARKLTLHKMQVIRKQCQSCRRCIEICPVGAVSFKKDKALINSKECILCACCQEICPHKAITIRRSLLLKILGA
ncbi:MAG: DUF362 domain-containing protein [Candidatus Omnitrophica bacterium]|nr:DUF362 domain-containing protein [Candidatus Omnitrophota bacterium]MDD5351943.1 DUF362 domain-containing protein [Candidatus Omnitrophota bacterium]MDD5550769.1 DUF362 domain-containing protein [Candidatus Omnitrophota bacterium]